MGGGKQRGTIAFLFVIWFVNFANSFWFYLSLASDDTTINSDLIYQSHFIIAGGFTNKILTYFLDNKI